MKKAFRLVGHIAVIAAGMFNTTLQAQFAPTNGLVAHYPLNGNAKDASGNGLNARAYGGVRLVSDRFGNTNSAFQFDGAGFLNISDPFGKLNFDARFQNYSVSLWFLLDTINGENGDQKFICDRYNNSPCSYDIYYRGSLNKFLVDIWDGGSGSLTLTSDTGTSFGIWHQISFVVSNRLCRLYLDGIENDSGGAVLRANVGTTKNSDGIRQIGSDGSFSTTRLHGIESDIRIYNRALSSSEIKQLFEYESQPKSLPQIVAIQVPPAISFAASKLTPPTNELAQISSLTGEVRVLDAKGLLMATNFVYLPRIPIVDLNAGDLQVLLENKITYSALTSFGDFRRRTEQSDQFENQMRQIWLSGKTLQEKIQTRLLILDEMRGYNTGVFSFTQAARAAGQSEAFANAANVNLANIQSTAALTDEAKNRLHNDPDDRSIRIDRVGAEGALRVSHPLTAQGQADIQAYVSGRNAEKKMPDAQSQAESAAKQTAALKQQIASYQRSCEVYASKLASYGISVPSLPPFVQIPPLSMRLEIDVERISKN